LIATELIVGRDAASQMAAESFASFLPPRT
jgi:hypothetical protein